MRQVFMEPPHRERSRRLSLRSIPCARLIVHANFLADSKSPRSFRNSAGSWSRFASISAAHSIALICSTLSPQRKTRVNCCWVRELTHSTLPQVLASLRIRRRYEFSRLGVPESAVKKSQTREDKQIQ